MTTGERCAVNGERAHDKRVHGFTLVELMLGASILIIAIVALLGAYVGLTFLNLEARNLSSAMNDATRIMEQIRRQNAGTTATCPGFPSAAAPAGFTHWNDWMNKTAGGGPKSLAWSWPIAPSPQLPATWVVSLVSMPTAEAAGYGPPPPPPSGQPQAGGRWPPAGGAVAQDATELIAVTCQEVENEDGAGASNEHCATTQLGANEWWTGARQPDGSEFSLLRVTVAVGWRQRGRTIGSGSGGPEFLFDAAENTLTVQDANGNGVIESQAMLTTLIACR